MPTNSPGQANLCSVAGAREQTGAGGAPSGQPAPGGHRQHACAYRTDSITAPQGQAHVGASAPVARRGQACFTEHVAAESKRQQATIPGRRDLGRFTAHASARQDRIICRGRIMRGSHEGIGREHRV